MNRAELAALIDHTLLAPTATRAQVVALCAEAVELGTAAVCVSPNRVAAATTALPVTARPGPVVATVCGFPSGAHHPAAKAIEAALAVAAGAIEVDMVVDLGAVADGDWDEVRRGIAAVVDAVPAPGRVKVIIESAALDDDSVVRCCVAAEEAGAAFVKTSTGFHPAGGATVRAVELMARTVGGRLGIKASGGIRDTAFALALIEAGATRIGASATRALLDGLP